MKKSYYLNIAISITLAALLLTGCEQNAAQKASTQPTSAITSPASTNNKAESEINYTEKLKSEGYSTKDIESAQSYVSRIVLQLNEIETFRGINTEPAGIGSENTDDSSKYSELLSKIDEQKAVYYLVKLNSDFNSIEDALNEYLLALQSDLDIDTYFKSKEKYNEAKNKKISGTNSDEFITVSDIEEKAIKTLQNVNNSRNNSNQTVPGINNPNQNPAPDVINPQPNIPSVEIPRPIDPSQEIRDKLGPQQ